MMLPNLAVAVLCLLSLVSVPAQAGQLAYKEVARIANSMANKYAIDAELLVRIVYIESCANPNTVGKAGEKGIAQLMPFNYQRFNVTNPFDATQNMEGAARYLSELQQYDTHPLVLAAMYNFGPKARKTPANRLPAVTKSYLRKLVNFEQTLQSCGVRN